MMPVKRPKYPPEFGCRLIELARAGLSAEELAGKFKPSAQTIVQVHSDFMTRHLLTCLPAAYEKAKSVRFGWVRRALALVAAAA